MGRPGRGVKPRGEAPAPGDRAGSRSRSRRGSGGPRLAPPDRRRSRIRRPVHTKTPHPSRMRRLLHRHGERSWHAIGLPCRSPREPHAPDALVRALRPKTAPAGDANDSRLGSGARRRPLVSRTTSVLTRPRTTSPTATRPNGSSSCRDRGPAVGQTPTGVTAECRTAGPGSGCPRPLHPAARCRRTGSLPAAPAAAPPAPSAGTPAAGSTRGSAAART